VEHCRGSFEKAAYLYQQSLEICRELGDKPGTSSALLNLGYIDLRQGSGRRAAARFRESLLIRREINDARGLIESLAASVGLALALGDAAAAGRLFCATEAALRSTHFHMYAVDRLEYERHKAAALSRLGEGAWRAALVDVGGMSLDEAADAALKLYRR
jgi:hypothetical protein